MASVKIIHYLKKKYSNGTSPVIIQIIDGKTIKRKVIGSVLPSQWNDTDKRVIPKKHQNYASLNVKIADEYNRIEKLLIENKFDLQRDFINYFNNEPTGNQEGLNFKQIADIYLKGVLAKNASTYNGIDVIVKKFLRLIGNEDIRLSEINELVMHKWVTAMQNEGNRESTIHNNIKIIRFVSKFGYTNKLDDKPEALHEYKASLGPKTYKTRLTQAEFEAFKAFELTPGTKIAEIRDMFLFAVYLRGVRISDIIQMKESYIVDGRLKYASQKTGKSFDIKLIPEALEIYNRYKTGSEYLFSFFTFQPDKYKTPQENDLIRVHQVKNITANINGKLKRIGSDAGIKTKISTHIARHTFARMALDKIKDSNITMDLLGHTSMKVHEAYIREISLSQELDDAADSIFG